ncbi:MAG: hypothetical protein AAB766_05015 [Patescibacteria group bacterium]
MAVAITTTGRREACNSNIEASDREQADFKNDLAAHYIMKTWQKKYKGVTEFFIQEAAKCFPEGKQLILIPAVAASRKV